MALADAVALARCLSEQPDAGRAFTAYEAIRREPTEQTVAVSARMSQRTGPDETTASSGRPVSASG
jgi:2-polyprenyl-6-methoxyphenol hydroxylase-like FAD-dependent oxidoreductase